VNLVSDKTEERQSGLPRQQTSQIEAVKLTPVEYALPEPHVWVRVRRCPEYKPIGLPHRRAYWYVKQGFGTTKYWRGSDGWVQHTPSQFETPEEAAVAFMRWASRE
jgi:hypothetical protein